MRKNVHSCNGCVLGKRLSAAQDSPFTILSNSLSLKGTANCVFCTLQTNFDNSINGSLVELLSSEILRGFRPFQVLFLFPVLFFTKNLPSLHEKKENLEVFFHFFFALCKAKKPTLPQTKIKLGTASKAHHKKMQFALFVCSNGTDSSENMGVFKQSSRAAGEVSPE